ncbi:glycoside hydrolase family 19 protein [Halomonas sp. 707B3]|uniref:glycoside hydrolase family 19 protein n=1 Tax=Halomonas sp. 707B3 TaxID=1681043 RepID=UPI0020A001C6|nr:glycoside hydrolase family 19 protein [Halomonas sp. 707B3]MCP1317841.1 hypothetical protein [Halomonas sp. 707B3]
MALNHDEQGFLAGSRLGQDEVSEYLESIRDELRAIRHDLESNSRGSAPKGPGDLLARDHVTLSPIAPVKKTPQEQREAREHAPTLSPIAPGAKPPERDELTVRVEVDSAKEGDKLTPATPTLATATPDAATGTRTTQAAITPQDRREAVGRTSSVIPIVPGANSPKEQREAREHAPTLSPIAPGAKPPERDSQGRFIGGDVATPSAYGDGDGDKVSMAVDGMGHRLSSAVQEIGAGSEESDPTVKAFNEVAQPLSRGFGKIMGDGSDRKQERWYRRFWTMMRGSRSEDRAADKRQQRILKSIERKPTGGGGGSMLWRGIMLLLAPLAGMLSLLGGLPIALAGAVIAGLKGLLTALGLGKLARRMTIPGSGRSTSQRGGGQAGRAAARAGTAGSTAARSTGQGGSQARGSGDARPSRGGRIAGALKAGGRRIPGIGALLGLGFMASDVAASERSDATREEKNVTTGRAVGGGLGGIGGMAGGAAAGAALGSVVPVIGTAVGGIVGAIAGGYFGGEAGEVLGEKAGQWLNTMKDSSLFQGMADSWHYASDFTSILWDGVSSTVSEKWDSVTTKWESASTWTSEKWDGVTTKWGEVTDRIGDGWNSVTDSIASRWESVTGTMQDHWSSAVDIAAKGWNAFSDAMGGVNDWIKETTGIDIAGSASEGAQWVSDTAVSSAQWTADRAGQAREWVTERTSTAAARASEAASDAAERASSTAASIWDDIKRGASNSAEWVSDTAPVRAVRNAASGASARGQRRQDAAAAEPALMAAMAEAGITNPNEQAAFMGQMHHESAGFTQLEESFNYSSSSRIMDVSRNARNQGQEAVEAAMAQGPEAVAELMYGGRMGNTEPGDGHRYRGRGFTQLTGRDNYTAASEALGIDLVNNPDMAADPEVAAKVATWYWQNRGGLSEAAQRGDTREVTRLINGGHNGLEDREAQTSRYLAAAQAGEFMPAPVSEPDINNVATRQSTPETIATVNTGHLGAMDLAARAPALGVVSPQTTSIPPLRVPPVTEAPTVSVPLSQGGKSENQRADSGQRHEDVSRDVSDRRIAHIVTGAYSGMS